MRRLQHDGKWVALAALLYAACSAGDPRVPWDTTEMVRELTAELRRFERSRRRRATSKCSRGEP
jgi:hypothetical protein